MLDAIKRRRSIREYTKQPVEDAKIEEILMAAMCSPSAHHLNPWEFVIVKDPETKKKLSLATDYAGFAGGAPIIIAATANGGMSKRWIEDCSVVATMIYIETTNQELGTCWIQIYDEHTHDGQDSEEYVRSILAIPKSSRVLCLMPIGYPAYHPPAHDASRLVPSKIHMEKW
jgi:nitroreductase